MEVHAHTHTAPGGTRKKWSHYLWEFLMLFFAVFCGFIAENIREHAVENKRGRQYLNSQIADLKTDTASLGHISDHFIKLAAEIDTFLYYFDEFGKNGMSKFFMDYALFQGYPDFIYTDRTIQQLKSSGGLRLIPNEASDSIINYDSHMQDLIFEIGALARTYEALGVMLYKIVNLKTIHDHIAGKTEPGFNASVTDLLLTTDKRELYTLYNSISGYKDYLLFISANMQILKELAIRLITFLTKEIN